MARLRILTLAATVAVSVPASAEPPKRPSVDALQSLSRFGEPQMRVERRGFSFPVTEYVQPDGSIQQRRGIIAGKEIAPGTTLGLGIFQTSPKMRGYVGDVPQNMAPRRNKRAAIGLSMKF